MVSDEASNRTDDMPGKDHFEALGRMVSEWAYLEMLIDHWAIAFLNCPPNVAVSFTGQVIGPARKLDALRAVIHSIKGDTVHDKDIGSLAGKIIGLGDTRNRMIHDPWDVSHMSAPHRFESTARRRVKVEWVKVPTDDLRTLRHNIETAWQELDLLMMYCMALPNKTA